MLKRIKHKTIVPIINYFGSKKESRHFSDPPIIIGACGRSGTTILLSILDAHPHIYSIPEQTYAFMKWRRVGNSENGGSRYTAAGYYRLYRNLLFRRIPESTTRWCEKTPMNVRYFEQILDYFGDHVRLIHIVRDGRDVVTSSHPYAPGEYWVPISRWINDVSAGLRFIDHPQVLTIRYEDLINSYQDTIKKICDFLCEECTPHMYSWIEHTRVRKSRHWFGTVKDLYTSSIGRWKEEKHRERVDELLADKKAVELLNRFGYL